MKRFAPWSVLLLLNVLVISVLGLYRTTVAGSPGGAPPFANTTESRLEMIQELKEIRVLLKEQNELLRSGQVKVIVTELPKAAAETGKPAVEDGAAEPAPGAPQPIEEPK
jgi:hypothetical protein